MREHRGNQQLPIITTRNAASYRGADLGQCWVFRGISYALPPFGPRRFGAPMRPASPDGRVDATAWGATPHRVSIFPDRPGVMIPGDDILNLNVFCRVAPQRGDHLPVIVWIHGGGFRAGTPSAVDGSAFAQDGIVCVTVAYRLGFDGFGYVEGKPANRGLLDVICALEWVRDNIADFGGDPTRVTIAGQSAGGALVLGLMASPLASGLFRNAWASSPALTFDPVDVAADVARTYAEALGVPATADGFAYCMDDALLSVGLDLDPVGSLGLLVPPRRRRTRICPVIDGEVIPEPPARALATHARDVSLLVGVMADELREVDEEAGTSVEDAVRTALVGWGVEGFAVDEYLAAVAPVTVGRAAGDLIFRSAFAAIRETRAGVKAPTYAYDYRFPLPATGLATHSSELDAFFGRARTRPSVVGTASEQLPESAHTETVEFIRDNNPGWSAMSPQDVRVYDAVCGYERLDDPAAVLRQTWL